MQPTRRQVPPSAGLPSLPERGVDAGGLQAELRGADGGVIAGGAGTDDDYVELFCHLSSFAFPFSRREKVPEGG